LLIVLIVLSPAWIGPHQKGYEMSNATLYRITGVLFVLGAVLVNVPYAGLISTFNYPDILREPATTVLTQFHMGGTSLLLTWFAFAWVGFPLLIAILLLNQILKTVDAGWAGVATALGGAGAVLQMVGLLRWVFVVPILAATYVDPAADEATRAAVEVVFRAVHQYGGVVLGEHLGQIFTIGWMIVISLMQIRTRFTARWLGWFGLLAAAIYSLAQGELFATVIPDFAYWSEAGLIGSLLWLLWMVALGISLIGRGGRE
jgi:hypothetical protein